MRTTEILIYVVINQHGQVSTRERMSQAVYDRLTAQFCEIWTVRARIPGKSFGALTEGEAQPFVPSFDHAWSPQ